MLGIAAERVFLLVCEATLNALQDANERTTLSRLLRGFAMKRKLDWVHKKYLAIQQSPPQGFPDNATLVITGIYDLLRVQRNDLGHPRQLPPSLGGEELFASLQCFPGFMLSADRLCAVLAGIKI